jgi:hypothetical protein
MSLTELKEQIAGLSPEERLKISAFLVELEQESEAEFRAEVERRMKDMYGGAKVTMERFEERHQRRQDDSNT